MSIASAQRPDPLIQYIVLREDLWTEHGWPLGSVVAQGCHAAVAAVWESREDPQTQTYCSTEAIDSMHKVRAVDWASLSTAFIKEASLDLFANAGRPSGTQSKNA